MNTHKNAYERVTERILELLDNGVCPWRRPWNALEIRPQNFVSQKQYNGINLFLLEAMAFQQPYFMTFKQVKEKGGKVIKGSKGFPVVYWGTIAVEDEHTCKDKEREKQVPFLKSYTVFNAAQIEGIEFPSCEPNTSQTEFQAILEAEQIVTNWQDCPAIEHDKGRAYYTPTTDIVAMPAQTSFTSSEDYYATLFHELGHATGASHRLNRKFGKRFGDCLYSREELVAEMTSAFLCANCGIDNSIINNAASYLDGWIKTLKGDSKLVVTAASQAQKAANLILGIKPGQQQAA